jgi:hypothetical protein
VVGGPGARPAHAARAHPLLTDDARPEHAKRAARPLDEPHPSRLARDNPDYDEIGRRHREAMARGDDGYIDPSTGLFVFTAAYHVARGHCCDSGCRHCPYVE